MWTLSSLAQRAKDAAAQIDQQINDAIGIQEEEESAAAVPPPSLSPDASMTNRDDDRQEETDGDGYLNLEEECVSFSKASGDVHVEESKANNTRQRAESSPSTGEISFVDLKNALPQSFDDGNSEALEDALGRIDLLEQQVKYLEMQLLSAKEEFEKSYASSIELAEQVRTLKEENKLLKKQNSLMKEVD
jgi:hypothetical protein